jgi:hypothetical protein
MAAMVETWDFGAYSEFAHLDHDHPFWVEKDDAFDEARADEDDTHAAMLAATPTTLAGVAAVLDVFGRDPYDEDSYSVLAWAYNNGDEECPVAVAMNELMGRLATTLRTMK